MNPATWANEGLYINDIGRMGGLDYECKQKFLAVITVLSRFCPDVFFNCEKCVECCFPGRPTAILADHTGHIQKL